MSLERTFPRRSAMSPVIGRRGKTHLRPIFHQLHHAHHQTTCQAHLVVWPSGLRRGQLTMVVKIRLARFGRRNSPFYNIVVAHARYTPALPLSSAFVDPRANFMQHGAQLPPARGPRHVRPRPQARPLRQLRRSAQRHQARHSTRAILDRRRRPAYRHGLEAALDGGHLAQEDLRSQGEQKDWRSAGKRGSHSVNSELRGNWSEMYDTCVT